ncbi:hypothetical protein OV079_51545 [Nannocystis pusilla]|uniref:Peroxiredoxin n=1 Tax=Nannocystis pusilla TaxID=889268 RepID=A0A9X3J3I8_9BACT|nr:hypothetical protein [Nannocystis pusilla]MCY1013826.1 hypothetical protein [Nannocystis pusilla]
MTLRLGDTAPNFQADTTHGPIDFYQWKGDMGHPVLAPETSRRCARPSSATPRS